MENKVFKGGLFAPINKIEISGDKITLFGKKYLKKQKSFSLKETSSVKLYHLHLENKGFDKYPQQKHQGINNFNMLLFDQERSFDISNKLTFITTSEGGTIAKPIPCAVFFSKNKPLFFIEYTRSPKFLKALVEIRKVIGKNLFAERINYLLDNYSPELERSLATSQSLSFMYLILMILLMIGGIFASISISNFIAPQNSVTVINFIFVFAIIFGGILGAAAPLVYLDRIFNNQKASEFIIKNNDLFQNLGEKTEKLFSKVAPIFLLIYLISLAGQSTSYMTLTDTGFDNYLFMQKISSTNFSDIRILSIYCNQDYDYDEAFVSVHIDSINGPLIYNESGGGFGKEKAAYILSKLPKEVNIKISRCFENANPKIKDTMDSLNYPVALS